MISETLNSLRRRVTWTNGRKMLIAAGCATGQGWAKTIAKVEEMGAETVNLGALQDQLIEHNLCGHKYTKLYEISDAERKAFQSKILSLPRSECRAGQVYPNNLDEEDLNEEPTEPQIVDITSNEDGMGVVLSAVVSLKKREEIQLDDFKEPEEIKALYDEVVGMKFMKVQLLHVVWIPHYRDYLEIRVDCPKGLTEALIHGSHSTLKGVVEAWKVIELPRPVDLFPAVRRFYDDNKTGVVTEITFATTTAAIKNEKMMRRQNMADQRTETYHVAGKRGLGTDISVFRITVEWAFHIDTLSYSPSLTLSASGPSGSGNSKDPVITGALIGNCIRAADYEFVIERLGEKAHISV
ncbi:hypothetical protein Q4578_06815 [Shimia thalassica]|uniref:hypothetical protein n=1 Tax=Shimia thalassica TaxID=1715693 RepID=UPI0026E23CFA|nr:hypothetical protein [Shimia thalassica]MDO6521291.1 hypothetical protein [Shimia thalassica]